MRLRKRRRRPVRRRHHSEYNRKQNDVLASLFGVKKQDNSTKYKPSVDIKKGQDGFEISVELPGVKKENVDVAVEEGVLKIQGKKESSEEEKENTYRSERTFGKFERAFKLPDKVDENEIEAKYKNGILKLVLPVNEEKNKQEISIH